MRKVAKTIVLPIYYSLYHDKNLTVNTLLYAQLLTKLFHCKMLLCLRKERGFLVVFFPSALAFLVPLRLSYGFECQNTRRVYRQQSIFIKECLINIKVFQV